MESEWGRLIGAVIGSGLIGAVLTYLISSKKEKREDFDTIVDVLQEENERLREENEKLRERIRHLEADNLETKTALKILEMKVEKLENK